MRSLLAVTVALALSACATTDATQQKGPSSEPFYHMHEDLGGPLPAWVKTGQGLWRKDGRVCAFGMVSVPRNHDFDDLHLTEARLSGTARLTAFVAQVAQQAAGIVNDRFVDQNCGSVLAQGNVNSAQARACTRLQDGLKTIRRQIHNHVSAVMVGVYQGDMYENGHGKVYVQQCISAKNLHKSLVLDLAPAALRSMLP